MNEANRQLAHANASFFGKSVVFSAGTGYGK